jgi:two-component system, response regulator YesN
MLTIIEEKEGYVYNICSLIHNLSKLNVEFIDHHHTASFQLFHSDLPAVLQLGGNETALYMYNYLQDKAPHDFFYYTDSFQLTYLGIGLWNNKVYKGAIIVGPFLSSIPDDVFLFSIVEKNHLPHESRIELHRYYHVLQILNINSLHNIGRLVVNLATNPFMEANLLIAEEQNLIIPIEKNEFKSETFYSEIELRYQLEKKVLHAIETGSKEEALKLVQLFQFDFSYRTPNDPLRAYKNACFSFNTLLRLAAVQGGVAPAHIHHLSDKIAILIEKVSNMKDLRGLQTNMVVEYCDLVKEMSTAGYSPIIQKAIQYIELHFDRPLSLHIIAEKINVHSSHLSRQFKKETKHTITEFIHKRRIKEAQFLIRQNQYSMTEIALMVGFENHNYFSTVFKKITSLTPREYLSQFKRL